MKSFQEELGSELLSQLSREDQGEVSIEFLDRRLFRQEPINSAL